MVVASANRVLVIDARDGALLNVLKGHKDQVYCLAYASDGTRFASGSADKCVIIWTNKFEAILKFTYEFYYSNSYYINSNNLNTCIQRFFSYNLRHNDALQCLAYNPLSPLLISCACTDFGKTIIESLQNQLNQRNEIASFAQVCGLLSRSRL